MTALMVRKAQAVTPDEKAFRLAELVLMAPDYSGFRRYQLIIVNRNDELAEYREDMGPAAGFTAPEFNILAMWEHSVAELREMADLNRDDYWTKRTAEIQAESTLIDDWIDQSEERREIVQNRSTFGPGYRKQRNGFDRQAAVEGRE
jgi:hypothetical protein